MWLSRLPDPHTITRSDEAPSFSENILFTEKISYRYSCPEYTSSFGLVTVLEGNGSFGINRQQTILDKEKFLVVNTHSRLSIDIDEPYTQPALLFFQAHLPHIIASSLIQTDEQLLNDHSNYTAMDFSILECLHPMDSALRNKLSLLTELGGSSSSFASLKADILARSILEDIVIQNTMANKAADNIATKKRATRIELYKRLCIAKDWIHANYHQPVTLDDLATISCMNSQHFLRTFKQLFSFTPHQYIINIRLEKARELLQTTDDPVHTVCRNTGWESLSSFSWLFKQRFGVSPSVFRKN